MRASIVSSPEKVTVGVPFTVELLVENVWSTIQTVTPEVKGILASSAMSAPLSVALFPQEAQTFTIDITLPKTTSVGDLNFTVDVGSELAVTDGALEVSVNVQERLEANLTAAPRQLSRGSKAKIVATVSNDGNSQVALGVSALDPVGELKFSIFPDSAIVQPQGIRAFEVVAKHRRPFIGSPAPREFRVELLGSEEPKSELITFIQKPLLGRGLLTALILISILVLWVVAIFVGFWAAGRAQETAVGANMFEVNAAGDPINYFNVGLSNEDLPSKNIRGRALAASNSSTLSRGGVIFSSLAESGEVFEGAIDEDGSFEVPLMPAGPYMFKAYGDGLQDSYQGIQWLRSGAVLDLGNIYLEGIPGSLRGYVTNRVGDPISEASIVIGPSALAEEKNATKYELATKADGAFAQQNLQTPASYSVIIAASGYDTMLTEIDLSQGQNLEDLTFDLVAQPSSIEGQVAAAIQGESNGQLLDLADVEILATSGEFSVATRTVEEGKFAVLSLPPLKTYVLTFSKPGYDSRDLVIEVGAGSTTYLSETVQIYSSTNSLVGKIQLSSSSESIEDLGIPNVQVLVSDGTLKGQTLSTSDGTYEFTGLEVGQHYVVTFKAEGYESASFDQPPVPKGASRAPLNVRLVPSTYQLEGSTISLSTKKAVCNIDVVASSGSLVLSTVTASKDGKFILPGLTNNRVWTVVFKSEDKNLAALIIDPKNDPAKDGKVLVGSVTVDAKKC
jgi:hypothetical protein